MQGDFSAESMRDATISGGIEGLTAGALHWVGGKISGKNRVKKLDNSRSSQIRSLTKAEAAETYGGAKDPSWRPGSSSWTRMTTKQATEAASKLGFEPTSHIAKGGEKVFFNRKLKTYISQDVGSGNGMGPHNGGVWKQAKTPEALNSKRTRMGTYDADLNRIGD